MYGQMLRPITLAVSLAIHASVFYQYSGFQVSAQNPHDERIVTKVNFKKPPPVVTKKPVEVAKVEPPPKKRPKPKKQKVRKTMSDISKIESLSKRLKELWRHL